MKSFAIWYTTQESENDSNVKVKSDVHFNLWRCDGKKEKAEYFLDIGFQITEGINSIKYLNIFVPFFLGDEDIVDLGTILRENRRLVNAVFNDDCTILENGLPKMCTIKKSNQNIILRCLNINSGWEKYDVELFYKGTDGTIIQLNIAQILNASSDSSHSDNYFRIRLKGDGINDIIKFTQPKDRMLQSTFETRELIDFRVNEKRIYPEHLLQEVRRGKELIIEKVHFLLLMNIDNNLQTTGQNYTARMLEEDIWDTYAEKQNISNNMVAYHWKTTFENTSTNFSLNHLIIIKSPRCTTKTIISFIAFAILSMGILTNILSELFTPYIIKFFTDLLIGLYNLSLS